MTSPQIILASTSPRRRQLLSQLGLEFTVAVQDIDEIQHPGEVPIDFVRRMAIEKVQAAQAELTDEATSLVIGGDTVVVFKGSVLGQPEDKEDGLRMLRLLSGKAHFVLTAVAVATSDKKRVSVSESKVKICRISEQEAEAYWQSREPVDKAGAYGIQGLGAVFVKTLHGSYSGVMGLPLYETAKLLSEFGINCVTSFGADIEQRNTN
ncbi:MAG: Maf family nucleotide pyrophosphatase [Pseudomonadales bacterium]|nr:Maf family nucleotide pyrophosphatase [Pseudomonadales bacterium]